MMKRKENLKDVKSEIPQKIAKIPIYNEVETEANVNFLKNNFFLIVKRFINQINKNFKNEFFYLFFLILV